MAPGRAESPLPGVLPPQKRPPAAGGAGAGGNGNRAGQLREDTEPHLSQTQLGACVGMSQRKISYLERGDAEPSLEDLRRFCLYYRISSDYFLDLPNGLSHPRR